MEKSSKIFEKEIQMIQDEELRMFATFYLDSCTPDYFFTIGASSSGKFHPEFAQGEGGLVRHTQAVMLFASELLKMSSYAYMKDEYKDYVLLACLLHDTCKYGVKEYDKTQYKHHAENASKNVQRAWDYYFESESQAPFVLTNAIATHMGQWGSDKPFTNVDRCVHMADYMASRSFIDIPSVRIVSTPTETTLEL